MVGCIRFVTSVLGLSLAVTLGLSDAEARPQLSPDARQIVAKVSDVYQHLRYFRSRSVYSTLTPIGGSNHEESFTVDLAVASPNKVRSEIGPGSISILVVSDGNQTWAYSPEENEYAKVDLSPDEMDPAGIELIRSRGNEGGELKTYKTLASNLTEAILMGSEAVTVDGKPSDCYKLRIKTDSVSKNPIVESYYWTIWVDKIRYLVLKDSMREAIRSPVSPARVLQFNDTVTVTSVSLNEPLPDSLFKFVPPAGAKERKQDSEDHDSSAVEEHPTKAIAAEAERMIGQPAGDFSLTDFDGRPVTLKGQTGKVVVLYFWASFCAPCVAEMPMITQVAREFTKSGVVLIGISEGGPATSDRNFLKSHRISLTTAIDTDGSVRDQYNVQMVPTLVVIGRNGHIASYSPGTQTEDEVRKAFSNAIAK